ncbi:alpha/beta-hydrolase [Imleria badia]|nr:alpha/beta-hydrolase [Imleria badia]
MSPNTPLTDEQRNAVTGLRTMLNTSMASLPLGTAQSVDERARRPAPESLPTDVTVRIEIAPPSPQPHPLLERTVFRTPERVPIYFYALRSDHAEPEPESAAELANTRVIFFIHGGGNITGHPSHPPFIQFYTQLLRAVASASADAAAATPKCVLIAPSYRLATVPENAFPAALHDLVAAYDYVLDKGYDASNVVIAGDSAGGNHALVLTHLVLQSSRPSSPHGVIVNAPSAMQVDDRLSEHAKAHIDKDILDVSWYAWMTSMYVGDSGASRTDPLLSGAFIPFTVSWPKTLILVGTADLLIDASRELAERLVALNRPVELVEYDERPHGWWVMPDIFPENIQDAVQRITQFILQ